MALNKNQISVLKFLELSKSIECKTKFQKMMFLSQVEEGSNTSYSFQKYHYGPFSFDFSDDLNALTQLGFIKTTNVMWGVSDGQPAVRTTFELSPEGLRELKENESELDEKTLTAIKKVLSWNDKPLGEVLNYVYSKYMGNDSPKLAVIE